MDRLGDVIAQLKSKYGSEDVDEGLRQTPEGFVEELSWRDELDQHYARLWLDYTYGGLYRRGVLTDRVRFLVGVAQCVAIGALEPLESNIRSALGHEASPREVLEVIFQTGIYVGVPKVTPSVRLFRRIVADLGRMDEITETQLPIDGRGPERSFQAERSTWRVKEEDFPRREEMMEKYGWQGISAGLRLQPTHHVETIEGLDRLDQHFLSLWLGLVYEGLYVRGILDDKTRLLCVVGVCTVLDELNQAYNHHRAALIFGATPREVLEVIVQSTVYGGMPRSMRAIWLLQRILEEQGRLSELTDTQLPLKDGHEANNAGAGSRT